MTQTAVLLVGNLNDPILEAISRTTGDGDAPTTVFGFTSKSTKTQIRPARYPHIEYRSEWDPQLGEADTLILAGAKSAAETLPDDWLRDIAVGRLVSTVPGLTLRQLKHRFPGVGSTVRAAVGSACRIGKTVVAYNSSEPFGSETDASTKAYLSRFGKVYRVDADEFEAAAALIGFSFPAMIEMAAAMVDSATKSGLDPLLAHELTMQSVLGGCAALVHSGDAPELQRQREQRGSDYGSLTFAQFDSKGFRGVLHRILQGTV